MRKFERVSQNQKLGIKILLFTSVVKAMKNGVTTH
jgi:hypothetical protein